MFGMCDSWQDASVEDLDYALFGGGGEARQSPLYFYAALRSHYILQTCALRVVNWNYSAATAAQIGMYTVIDNNYSKISDDIHVPTRTQWESNIDSTSTEIQNFEQDSIRRLLIMGKYTFI